MKEKQGSGFWDKRSRMFDSQVLEVYKNAYKKTVKRSAAFLNQEILYWKSAAAPEL